MTPQKIRPPLDTVSKMLVGLASLQTRARPFVKDVTDYDYLQMVDFMDAFPALHLMTLGGYWNYLKKKHNWSRQGMLFNMKEMAARAKALEAELKNQRARYDKLETEALNVKSHIGSKKWGWMSKRKKYKRH